MEPAPLPPTTSGLPAHCLNQLQNTTESDVDCGGPDCLRCGAGRGCVRASDCFSGQCFSGSCQDPTCANEKKDGAETDVDCGGWRCRACVPERLCLVASDCTSGVCTDQSCAEATCNDQVKNGDELGLDCGAEGCPGCAAGTPCSAPAQCASGSCQAGQCDVSCSDGTAECDGDLNVECEARIDSDPTQCGQCGQVCTLEHAEPSCAAGVCAIATCQAPYSDCNGEAADGCETNLNGDADHCGACELTCPRQHATPSCVEGTCALTCDLSYGDCDRDPSTGCETAIDRSVEHCGGCHRRCTAPAGETPICRDAQCGTEN